MSPYMRISVALLMIAVNLYWIAALFIILIRIKEPFFQRLTQYSGRLAPAAPHSSGSEKAERRFCRAGAGAPSQSRTRAGSSVAQVTASKASSNGMQHVVSLVQWIQSSVLGSVRVGRQNGFCIFYLSGILTCSALWAATLTGSASFSSSKLHPAPLLHAEACLPLLAFTIHVVVRLTECLVLQEFRDQNEDRMSLFATLAGSSFYVFAPLSSNGVLIYFMSLWCREALPSRMPKVAQSDATFDYSVLDPSESHISSWSARLLMWSLFIIHILVQLLQVAHHCILSGLRRSSAILSKGDLTSIVFSVVDQFSASNLNSFPRARKGDLRGNEDITDGGLQRIFHSCCGLKGENVSISASEENRSPVLLVKDRASDRRVWTYQFPQRLLFAYVQEPHYSCEIVMYGINFMAMLVLFVVLFPCHAPLHLLRGPVYTSNTLREIFYPFFSAEHIAWMQLSAALFVGLFTLCNLAITSSEHQKFWRYLNSTRNHLWYSISQLDVAKQEAFRQNGLSCGKACKVIEKLTQPEAVPKWRLLTFIY